MPFLMFFHVEVPVTLLMWMSAVRAARASHTARGGCCLGVAWLARNWLWFLRSLEVVNQQTSKMTVPNPFGTLAAPSYMSDRCPAPEQVDPIGHHVVKSPSETGQSIPHGIRHSHDWRLRK